MSTYNTVLRHVLRNPYITSARLSETKRAFMAENPNLMAQGWKMKWVKFCYYAHGFPKIGLWRDDCLNYGDPVVREAVRRLPQSLMDERNYRLARAEQMVVARSELPKEEWTQWEDDVLYLEPFINEVKAELKNKKSFANQGSLAKAKGI